MLGPCNLGTLENQRWKEVLKELWTTHEYTEQMMAVFWVAPCGLVEVYQRFRGPCCLHHQGDE
jgi:hypothetical protein